jgi:hypothetical protein
MHSLETVGVYPGLAQKKLRQMFLDCLQKTFQLKWKRQFWSVEELKMISERENYFQNLNIN